MTGASACRSLCGALLLFIVGGMADAAAVLTRYISLLAELGQHTAAACHVMSDMPVQHLV